MRCVNIDDFRRSLSQATPPDGFEPALAALWHEAKGDWHRAHELAQSQDDARGAWVHAYLHRKEGDLSNAAYWYRRAERAVSKASLGDEWSDVAAALLASNEHL